MEIANEESIYQANTVSTKQGKGPVQKLCTCSCGKRLLYIYVQFFLEILIESGV